MVKVQSQLLVSPVTRDRADALALVRQEPRAEVYRVALEGQGLGALEAQHADALRELDEIAKVLGVSSGRALAARMLRDKIGLDDVRGRRRYPIKATAKA